MAAAARAAIASAASPPSASPSLSTSDSHLQRLSFSLASPASGRSLSRFLGSRLSPALPVRPAQGHQGARSSSWISPVNEVAVDGSSNSTAVATSKVELKSQHTPPEKRPAKAREATISAIMADVANLVKLVDSRDIVELELKHLDYELVIRKKEALPPPPVPPSFTPPQMVMQAPYPAYAPPPPPPPTTLAPPTVPALTPAVPPASELPRMLSPMAGTFYRSPAPGEPAFVKVGDKVQRGQVICIVEAMKLMNEIEADQTGTIVEIIAEDAKPVSVDTPLFLIRP